MIIKPALISLSEYLDQTNQNGSDNVVLQRVFESPLRGSFNHMNIQQRSKNFDWSKVCHVQNDIFQ